MTRHVRSTSRRSTLMPCCRPTRCAAWRASDAAPVLVPVAAGAAGPVAVAQSVYVGGADRVGHGVGAMAGIRVHAAAAIAQPPAPLVAVSGPAVAGGGRYRQVQHCRGPAHHRPPSAYQTGLV